MEIVLRDEVASYRWAGGKGGGEELIIDETLFGQVSCSDITWPRKTWCHNGSMLNNSV